MKYHLCIVIPCYNESDLFLHEDYIAFLKKFNDTLICFVNDGSSDNTDKCILSLKNKFQNNIEVISHDVNKGKSAAVKTGFNHCNSTYDFKYIAYLDADLAVSLNECYNLTKHLKNDIDFVFGSRVLRIGSKIVRKPRRHYIGRVIATIISYILSLKVYDSQCGCKIFKKELSLKIFTKPFISRWLFDVEIFFRILNYYGKEVALTKMLEIPLKQWIDRGDSKVKASYFFNLWIDLLKIKREYSENKKTIFSRFKPSFTFSIATLLALIMFHVSYGLETIIPTNINWLLSAYHDWGQHYLGWTYFRDAPWSFPIGEMNNYYYPIGTNIGFTDSIPLLAILLKPFTSFLPSDFQYFGFFMLSTFVFGAYYTLKILNLYKVNKVISIGAAIFVISSPLFIFRGMHPALTAHWLILASIYYNLLPTNKSNVIKNNWKQTIIFLLSAAIHPYLAAMIFGFCIILPLKNYFYEKSLSFKKTIVFPFISLSFAVLFWVTLGLIDFKKSTGFNTGSDYGENTFNLNSFFNPYDYYSNFLEGLPMVSIGQHEGFSYLGLGMMIIIVIAIFYFSILVIKRKLSKRNKALIPLFSLVFLLLLFSISHIVTFGNTVLFEVTIPDILKTFGGIFRGSGRFCWPFYYVLILFSIILFSKIPIPKMIKNVLFIALLGLQLYDIENILTSKDLEYGSYSTKLEDKKWVRLFNNFDEIITYPPFEKTMLYNLDYQDLMYLASKAKTPISTGYVARSKPIHKYVDSLNSAIFKLNLNKKTLFVTTSKFIETFKTSIFYKKLQLKKLDDFVLLYSNKINLDSILIKSTKYQDSIFNTFNVKIHKKASHFIKLNNVALENKNQVKFEVDKFSIEKNAIKTRGWAFNTEAKTNINDSIFISFTNKTDSYLFNSNLTSRPDVTAYFKKENIDSCGFKDLFFLNKIPYDTYRVGFVIKNKKIVAHSKTNLTIETKPID